MVSLQFIRKSQWMIVNIAGFEQYLNYQLAYVQLYTTNSPMFPIDDICNVQAAKGAAQRLFRKYKNLADKQQPVLGRSQVGKLMKDTYQTINMPYDPNEEDVFSFINIFDSNSDGKIELKDFQEMAVKYLCGIEALSALGKVEQGKGEDVKQQREQGKGCSEQRQKKQVKSSDLCNEGQLKQIKEEENDKDLLIDSPKEASGYRPMKRVFSSNHFTQPQIGYSVSPKSRESMKQSATSTNNETGIISPEITQSKKQVEEIAKKGRLIFQKYSEKSAGITQSTAGRVISESYELFNRKGFVPSGQDVKIWMKLCDLNKDGVVEWEDYRYFLQRTYERSR